MSSRTCFASFLYSGSSTSPIGSVASAVNCSRAFEYLPRSTYTSPSSRRWKMLRGFRATAFSRYRWASSQLDRKSTRLNSSHGYISYAVFCLKKKKKLMRGRAPHLRGRRPHLTAHAHPSDQRLRDRPLPLPRLSRGQSIHAGAAIVPAGILHT